MNVSIISTIQTHHNSNTLNNPIVNHLKDSQTDRQPRHKHYPGVRQAPQGSIKTDTSGIIKAQVSTAVIDRSVNQKLTNSCHKLRHRDHGQLNLWTSILFFLSKLFLELSEIDLLGQIIFIFF